MGILFPEVRTTSVRLVWQPPAAPNGIILGRWGAILVVPCRDALQRDAEVPWEQRPTWRGRDQLPAIPPRLSEPVAARAGVSLLREPWLCVSSPGQRAKTPSLLARRVDRDGEGRAGRWCPLRHPHRAAPFPAAYQVTHCLNTTTTANAATVEVLEPSARQYTATGLQPEATYLFRIAAQTRKGWGEAAEALVVTTEKRGNGRGVSSPRWGAARAHGVPAALPAPRLSQTARSPPGSRWRSRRRCEPAACCSPGSRAATGSPPSATTRCRAASCPTASGHCTPPPSAATPPPSSWTGMAWAGPQRRHGVMGSRGKPRALLWAVAPCLGFPIQWEVLAARLGSTGQRALREGGRVAAHGVTHDGFAVPIPLRSHAG